MPEVDRAAIEAALLAVPVARRGFSSTLLRDSLLNDLPKEACWPWAGAIGTSGYGHATIPVSGGKGTTAHRLVWTVLFGIVPDDMQVDHICHNPDLCQGGIECAHRRCVNPRHLAVVTPLENSLRSNGRGSINAAKVACLHGHDFTVENTYVDPKGHRQCIECRRTVGRASDRRRRQAVAS